MNFLFKISTLIMKTAIEAMYSRRSIREFENERVPQDVIQEVIKAAGAAPSSKNTQPWLLYLVQGKALDALKTDMLAAFDAGEKLHQDYPYSPNPMPDNWMSRARACGIDIFKLKGIDREDKEKRRLHDRENFHFFGAQQVFFVGTNAKAYAYGTFMDCGFFMGNLMLSLDALGYGSCPQYSAVGYPELLRKHIPNSQDTLFMAALPFGHARKNSLVNTFQPARLPVEEWFKTVE